MGKTPKRVRRIILETLREIGGSLPNDPFHIRMFTNIIIHKKRFYIDGFTVRYYLLNASVKGKNVKLENNVFILVSNKINNEDNNMEVME